MRGRCERGPALALALIAVLLCAATALAVTAQAGPSAQPGLRAATTVGKAETATTIPITRRKRAEPRVALSLGAHRLRALHKGDRLRGLGEVQVTNTCVEPSRACVGPRYSFSPRVSAWLVLARSRSAARGRGATRISKRAHVTCGQRRPNRNHHCVLVIPRAERTVRSPRRLPCRLQRCYLNLVVAAHHPDAEHGNRLIIGADRPDGSFEQGKGRVSAIVIRAGSRPLTSRHESRRRVNTRVPMSTSGDWVSVYSVRLTNLQQGEVITARARQVLGIAGIPNAVFDSNQLVLTRGRRKVRPSPLVRRSATPRATLSEANGFNCTHGPSAYRTPCVSRKVGLLTIRHPPVDHRGHPVPLYVNLIARGFVKVAQPQAKRVARAKIKRGGYLKVKRYRAR
jgi:hypothetical protein